MTIINILVPIDGSEESRRALSAAAVMVEKFEARLALLYVADLNQEMTGLDRVTMSGYIPSEIISRGYDVLHAVEKDVPPSLKLEETVLLGDPAEQILKEQKEKQADLIVMGSRGLGAIRQVIMGSVSQTVLHRAPCPVLIVK